MKNILSIISNLMIMFTPISLNEVQQTHIECVQQKQIGIKTPQGKLMKVDATAYTNDPITSTGTKPIEGRTIAVDPTIIPYGTKVYIPYFNRTFIAEDCGSAIKGNRMDIFMNDYNQCMEFGYRSLDIYIIKE